MSTVESSFPVVGIGASAGGVEALESFFKNVPADSGCAFVVVTHLSPDRPSLLAQLIQRMTTLPVTVAEQGVSLAPNTVHVMAPDTTLGIAHGRLQVHRLGAGRRERKPVDIFLSELATDLGEYAVGVIL